MDGDPAPEAVIRSKKEEAAREALAAILKESPQMGVNKLRNVLKEKGHGKGSNWITMARARHTRHGRCFDIGIAHTPYPYPLEKEKDIHHYPHIECVGDVMLGCTANEMPILGS